MRFREWLLTTITEIAYIVGLWVLGIVGPIAGILLLLQFPFLWD